MVRRRDCTTYKVRYFFIQAKAAESKDGTLVVLVVVAKKSQHPLT